jgi:amino acid transporter
LFTDNTPASGRARDRHPQPIEVGTEGERSLRPGRHAGDRAVRIIRPRLEGFRATAPGYMLLEREPEPKGGLSRTARALKRFLIGAPIPTAHQMHERLTKVKALAVFSSDALSSVAYSTEAILIALVAGGPAAIPLVLPIAIAITILLAVVATSYRQTIYAYPNGGGSYIVAKDNLGTLPGLIAGAALLIDYVLTVAVSVSAGVSAVTSALPSLHPYQVEICLGCIAIICILNLRGVRESGSIFAVPTYLFIVAMLTMIVVGLVRLFTGNLPPVEQGPEAQAALASGTQAIGLVLILNAFAQGCSAMTGVEAISNGIPAFKPPESRNAAITLVWMATLLGTMVVGTAVLARALGIIPSESETVLSVMGTAIFGSRGFAYQFLQWSTFLILVLAANTSFADFPRLASIMARDKFLANQFAFRGDRLAFTNGIVLLGGLAAILVLIYHGSEQAMIPLYAVGVFLSFTLSQAGMVVHWYRLRGPNWRRSMGINGLGACTTAVVLAVIVSSKFVHGAWMVVVLIPILVAIFLFIEQHYRHVQDQLAVSTSTLPDSPDLDPHELYHTIVIPVSALDRAAIRAVAYARSLTGQVDHPDEEGHTHIVAVHVTDDVEAAEGLKERWDRSGLGVPLVILESPYRSLVGPVLQYVNALERQRPEGKSIVTVLLPEFIPAHWWEFLLHTQTALRLKGALLFRARTAVTSVPYHLQG